MSGLTLARRPALYGDARRWALIEADALTLLTALPACSASAIVTDPPYGIDFAKMAWDGADMRREAGPTTPGEAFERFSRAWAAECLRVLVPGGHLLAFGAPRTVHRLVAGIEDAGLEVRDQLLWLYGSGVPKTRRVNGRASDLKPAYEPIVLARRPLDGTTDDNELRWGAGRLGIDEARVPAPDALIGRWPANLAWSHDAGCSSRVCADTCPGALMDAAQPDRPPSRFFYCSKPARWEREAGLTELPLQETAVYGKVARRPRRNVHPTVKPLGLMRWLVRLVVPPGGVVLDPFAGSGTTGAAALLEGRQFVGIEQQTEYVRIARARIGHWANTAPRAPVRRGRS